MPATRRRLSGFTGIGYDIGRDRWIQGLWLFVSTTIFMRWWLPSAARVRILRMFGASIGEGVLIRHRVRIHWPWKLSIGSDSWIGEGVWLLNLEPITIGSDVCVSQDVLLCAGSHDRHSPTFEFASAPIQIADGAWVATRAVVLAGVSIGSRAVVAAGAVVRRDVPADSLIHGPGARIRD